MTVSTPPPSGPLRLEEAIALVICPRYPLGLDGLDFGDGDRILPGGYCVFAVDLPDSLDSLATARPPDSPFPYVCSDLERGAGQQIAGMSRLPPALALGAANEPALAYAAGDVTGREARAAAISFVFAPVLDVATEPRNPIVASRSFGSDPELVARLANAWIEGCRGAGSLPVAKHYPGHGATTIDSHLTLPRIDRTLAELEAIDEAPFRAAIDAGVPGIMAGHLHVPAIDAAAVPATLSPALIGARLRGELGFEGIVFTDALDMGAIVSDEEEPTVTALAAGVDVPLLPADPERAARAVLAAVRSGRLPESRVREAAERIRSRVCALKLPHDPTLEPDPSAAELALRIARHSVVANDAAAARGPGPTDGLRVAAVDDGGGEAGLPRLLDALRRNGIMAEPLGDDAPDPKRPLLIATFADVRASKGRVQLGEEPARQLHTLLTAIGRSRDRVHALSVGCPQAWDELTFVRDLPTHYVFDYDSASLTAAAEALAGNLPARGRRCWNAAHDRGTTS